jgi:hypothetical protein
MQCRCRSDVAKCHRGELPHALILRPPTFCRLLSAISNGLKRIAVPMFSNGEQSTEQEKPKKSLLHSVFSSTPPRWTPHSPPFSCPRLHSSGSPFSLHHKSRYLQLREHLAVDTCVPSRGCDDRRLRQGPIPASSNFLSGRS